MEQNFQVPSKVFFTKGVGRHKHQLQSFELALRDAGISQFNLVTVSSILPPGCKRVTREEGLKSLKPGQIVFCVLARNATSEPNRLAAASISCAWPSGQGQVAECKLPAGRGGACVGDCERERLRREGADKLPIEEYRQAYHIQGDGGQGRDKGRFEKLYRAAEFFGRRL